MLIRKEIEYEVCAEGKHLYPTIGSPRLVDSGSRAARSFVQALTLIKIQLHALIKVKQRARVEPFDPSKLEYVARISKPVSTGYF